MFKEFTEESLRGTFFFFLNLGLISITRKGAFHRHNQIAVYISHLHFPLCHRAPANTHLWHGDSAREPSSLHVDEPGVLQGVAAQGETLSREHGVGPHLQARQAEVAVPQHAVRRGTLRSQKKKRIYKFTLKD